MAILKIIKGIENWLEGNLIEASGARKDELVNGGFALIVKDDVVEPKVDFTAKQATVAPKKSKKGGVKSWE